MEVSVLYEGKRYKYCDVGTSRKWVDNRNIVVPVVMNDVLRRHAIENGIGAEEFLAKKQKKPERVRTKRTRTSSRTRKGSVSGGINLSSLIKAKGDDNDKK
jgi:hypothetical protein